MYDGLDAFIKFYRHNFGDPALAPSSSSHDAIENDPFGDLAPKSDSVLHSSPTLTSTNTTAIPSTTTSSTPPTTFTNGKNTSYPAELKRSTQRPVHPEIRRMLIKELETTREAIFEKHLYKPRTRKGPSSVVSLDAINNLVNHWPSITNLHDFNTKLGWKTKWSSQYGESLYQTLRALEKKRVAQIEVDDARTELRSRKRKSQGYERDEASRPSSREDDDGMLSDEAPVGGTEVTPRKRIKAFKPRLIPNLNFEKANKNGKPSSIPIPKNKHDTLGLGERLARMCFSLLE